MRSFSLFVSIALLAGASTACGGKNISANDEVRERVVALSQPLEESDSQIDRNTAGIREVSQTANAARRTKPLGRRVRPLRPSAWGVSSMRSS